MTPWNNLLTEMRRVAHVDNLHIRPMKEPEPNDFASIVLSVLFCLVVATAVGGILAYSHLTH